MLSHLFRILGSSRKPDSSFLEPSNVKNILIVRQHNQLGDMLCSVPLFAAIRKKYPGAHITLVASPINYEILFSDINPFIDKVITYRKASARELRDFYGELRHHDYQIGLVPSTVSISRTSHFINYFSGAKVRVGVNSINGKNNKVSYLLNVKDDFSWDSRKLHQVERNLEVGNLIGCSLTKEELAGVRIHLDKSETEFAWNFMRENFPGNESVVVSFHPGAGKAPNRWSPENFVSLIRRLKDKYECGILITSGNIDKPITDDIGRQLNALGIRFVILDNTPIRKVAAVIKQTALYITNDTGTMHVAGGVNANVVSLFGPTHGYEWAPKGEGKIFVQSPTTNINDITVNEVFDVSASLLDMKLVSGCKAGM
jgi:heptosyltransferase-2